MNLRSEDPGRWPWKMPAQRTTKVGSGWVFANESTTYRYGKAPPTSKPPPMPSLFQTKTVICVLHARRHVGSSAQTLQVGVASDGQSHEPVRRIARGGGGSALLEGRKMRPRSWEDGRERDGRQRFRPGFCRRLRSPLSHLSFPCNGSQYNADCAGLSHLLSTA